MHIRLCLALGVIAFSGVIAAQVPPPIDYQTSAYSRGYVQKAYVAYYGRAADPGGLNYWAARMDAEGQSLGAIIGAFGNSAEFAGRYGGLSYPALVTKIYQQALARNPDQGGLDYYVGELQAGRRTLQSITLDVLNGAATAPDSTAVANKLAVAGYYTVQVAAGCAYGTENEGVSALSGVTDIIATATGAKALIDSRCGLYKANQRKDAARFLRQATFGATREAIDALVAQGYDAWLDEQFAKPAVSHLATVKANPDLPERPFEVTEPSLWKQYFEGEDQLRQRVSFALSQIFVISLNNMTVQNAHCGPAAYLDILNRGAFGDARTLLRDVTLSPAMGEYLSMKESAKADPVVQTQPDENYAREVMQLFSVGTVMLDIDGSVQVDSTGKPLPTYNEDTVKGLAKALSGWTHAGQDQTKPGRWLSPDIGDPDPVIWTQKACPAWSEPMQPWTTAYRSSDNTRNIPGPPHDTDAKQLLVYPGAPYSTLPAGQSAQTDLENVVDNLFHHPNVGPFLAKQLIQRLVTSNPRPAYVERVARKFNDNGSGVRGDMKAVVRAILLDGDARSLAVASQPSFGKLTEPVVRFVQFHRAFNARRVSGYYNLWNVSAPTALNQHPLRAQSVFNFYHPNFTPAGPLSESGLVGPEFEITTASSVAGYANFSQSNMIEGFDYYNKFVPGSWIAPDYTYYLGLAASPAAMVDALDLVLCTASMNPALKAQVAQAAEKVVSPQTAPERDLQRLYMVLWLLLNSPDCSVQK